MSTPTLAHVHVTTESVPNLELTPPHPPRTETPEYEAAHKFLVHEKKAGCDICGVTIDTLEDTAVNLVGAKAMETHHFPIERSLADACDPMKVHADFPSVYNVATLMAWVDSPANLLVLCDVHHRSPEHGIHHLLIQDWKVQKYLRAGYQIVATQKDVAAATAHDDQIEQTAGLEPQNGSTPAPPPPRKRATPNGKQKAKKAPKAPVVAPQDHPVSPPAPSTPATQRQRAPRRGATGPRRRKAPAPAGAA